MPLILSVEGGSLCPPAPPEVSDYVADSWWLHPIEAARTLLVVGAHPDDETLGIAGPIARCRERGIAVHYVCATLGECGTAPVRLLAGCPDIAALRLAELRCSALALDLTSVQFLGYRNSGMHGSPDNHHASALIQAPRDRVTAQLVALIRTLRPQVVLTFGPYGSYRHPDHICIHEVTRAAFGAAGDTAYSSSPVDGLAPWNPDKLYYSTFATLPVRLVIALLRLMRKDLSRFGENGDVDLLRVARETTPITTSVNVVDCFDRTDRARRCHRSQLGGLVWLFGLPPWLRRPFLGTAQYTRVVPPASGDTERERDLFAGIPQ